MGVKIDLSDTLLEDRTFESIAQGDSEDREATWISCYKQDCLFIGHGSYDKLDAILCEFLDWADANTDTSPWDGIVTEIGAKPETISKGHPSAAREQLRELFQEIDRIPTEHPGENGLLKKFDSVWKGQWKDGGERKTTTQESLQIGETNEIQFIQSNGRRTHYFHASSNM